MATRNESDHLLFENNWTDQKHIEQLKIKGLIEAGGSNGTQRVTTTLQDQRVNVMFVRLLKMLNTL